MRKYILLAAIFPLFSFLLVNTVHAENTLSGYVGLKFGYNYTMFGSSSATGIDGLPGTTSLNYNSGSFSSGTLGFIAGITIPLTPSLAIRPALEYSFMTPSSVEFSSNASISPNPFATFAATLNSHTLFGNLYLDYYVLSNIYLYAGGGIGVSAITVKMRAPFESKNSTNAHFSWNAGVGFGYYIVENVLLDFGVRYVDIGRSDSINIPQENPQNILFSDVSFSTIEAMLSIAYKF